MNKNRTEPQVLTGRFPSLHWGMEGVINPSEEATEIFNAALKRFDEEVASGIHKEVYLLSSYHWATEGYWIEFHKPKDLNQTVIVKQWPAENTN